MAIIDTAARLRSKRAAAGLMIRRIDSWLMFGDHAEIARNKMLAVWACIIVMMVADLLWISFSSLSFVRSTWSNIGSACLVAGLAVAICTAAVHRLCDDEGRVARLLRSCAVRVELLWRGAIITSLIALQGVVFSYFATAAALPLQDRLLAEIDRSLGFIWPSMLVQFNATPWLADALALAYQSIGFVACGTVVLLSLSAEVERLSELLALLCVSVVGLCATMLLVPAAGAFAYYDPSPQQFASFGARDQMWTFFNAFAALRDGTVTQIDLSHTDGIVSFPSFHTILGIITAYALRDWRLLRLPILLLNATMIVSTLPVGGHHLVDLVAGAGVAFGSILLVRRISSMAYPSPAMRNPTLRNVSSTAP